MVNSQRRWYLSNRAGQHVRKQRERKGACGPFAAHLLDVVAAGHQANALDAADEQHLWGQVEASRQQLCRGERAGRGGAAMLDTGAASWEQLPGSIKTGEHRMLRPSARCSGPARHTHLQPGGKQAAPAERHPMNDTQ